MTTSKTKFLMACAASVLLAVALSACGGGGGGGGGGGTMVTEPEPPDPQALANVVDLVANDNRQDSGGGVVGGWYELSNIGNSVQQVVSGRHRDGRWVDAIVSHDDDDQLQYNVVTIPNNPLQESGPRVWAYRYIDTHETADEIEGVTRTARPITDHELGESWQVTKMAADYDDGGTLSVYVATDAQPSDGSMDPYETATGYSRTIELAGAPEIPGDADFIVARIGHGQSIGGSLDGVEGSFSCDNNYSSCSFRIDRTLGTHAVTSSGVTFTPDDGTPQDVPERRLATVPPADYLAFGHWLYVPEDVTDSANYDFGTFAGGGDPFEVSNLEGLTEGADYAGSAVGMYYVDGLSDNPTVGSFRADVTLEADFGDATEIGFISGTVNNFDYEDESLPALLTLSTDFFHTLYPGGHIGGEATANVEGEDWYGQWHAAFFGNGASPTDRPTGVAGTFNIASPNDNMRSDAGLTGAFGAHKK